MEHPGLRLALSDSQPQGPKSAMFCGEFFLFEIGNRLETLGHDHRVPSRSLNAYGLLLSKFSATSVDSDEPRDRGCNLMQFGPSTEHDAAFVVSALGGGYVLPMDKPLGPADGWF